MESLLAWVAAWAWRRPRPIVCAWLALVAASAWFALHQTDHLSSGGWEVADSQSARAAQLLDRFDSAGAAFGVLVEGRSAAAAMVRAAALHREVAGIEDVEPGPGLAFAGGRALLLPLVHRGPTTAAVDVAGELRARLVRDDADTRTRVVGSAAVWSEYQDVSKRQLAQAEALGFPLVAVILLAAFGTVVAALAPLVLGVVVVVIAGAVIYLLSLAVQMSLFVTSVASMIGIGVAVDYSLFVVSRFRAELRTAQTAVALQRALASAGTAVVYSGITVVLSLGALLLVGLGAIRSVAIGAAVVVVLAVLAAVTLLPALLAVAGERIERLPVGLRRPTGEAGDERFWRAWTARTSARPALSLVIAGGLLALLASPVVTIQTANRYLDQLPRDSEVRAATERVHALLGAGALAPVHVIVSERAAAEEVRLRSARLAGVADAGELVATRDGSLFAVDVILEADPEAAAARPALARVERTARVAAERHGATLVVGGASRLGAEVQDAVVAGLWKMIAFILAVAYVVLLVLLRSVVLPLKAVAINLLGVAAAYGVLVAVFQWGWLDWTGYSSPGHIDTIVLALVLAVTFGLSMDYEVFLLTRIAELYRGGLSNAEAVREGLTRSARTITSAAAIMVAVFGAFAIAGATSVKQLGIGLAVAITLDATLVRLVIVPAAMQLLGDWNWWLPRPLARLARSARTSG